MNPIYRSVLIFSHSEYREFFPAVARALKKDHQSRIIFYCATEQEKQYYLSRHGDTLDSLHSIRFFYESLLQPLKEAPGFLKKAENYEKRYRFLFTHLIADDRHMGLGFSPGATNFPRSVFSRNAEYLKCVRAFVLLLEHFESVIEKERVTFIINPVKALSMVARGRGIPQRIFTATRYKNYYYWAVDDVLDSNMIRPAFERLKGVRCEKRLERQPDYYLQSREKALKAFEFRTMVRNIGYEAIRRIYHRLRRYEKATGYLLKDNMLAHYRMWAQFRELMKLSRRKLIDVQGRCFIYFPLGVEPERSLTRDSPEFCHQHYAAQAVAKDLPAGTYLAIKEHLTAVGPRPRDFYKSFSMMSNVIMLDPLEPSLDIIKAAKAVATVTGTAGLEAAFMGVPVISFGKHNIYRLVSHVHTVTSWLSIPETVRSILDRFEDEKEKREQEGARFLQAMIDISVDFGNTEFNKPIAPAVMAETLHLLEASVEKSQESVGSQ